MKASASECARDCDETATLGLAGLAERVVKGLGPELDSRIFASPTIDFPYTNPLLSRAPEAPTGQAHRHQRNLIS